MVAMADPKLGETVYDPFCGTGGFLTESFRYIRQSGNLTAEERDQLKSRTLFGREITKTAVIAKMNMVLYGDGHSGVEKEDSLENPIDNRFDVVLTNIPFSQNIPERNMALYYNGLANNDGDAACLLHCFRSLRSGGRMAVVVPEGFLENRNVMKTRKFLSDNSEICTVVRFPRGCFQPYTLSSTAMIFLKNKQLVTTSKFWFINVENDGFTLDAHREKIYGENDLDRLQFAFSVEKSILENPSMQNMPNGRLRVLTDEYSFLVREDWEPVLRFAETSKLVEVARVKKGESITGKTAGKGSIPVIAGGRTSPYNHNKSNYIGNSVTVSASGAYSGYVQYHEGQIWASDCTVIQSIDESNVLTRYIYYCMKAKQSDIYEKQRGTGQPHVYPKDLYSFPIPMIEIEEQKKIVSQLMEAENRIRETKSEFKKSEQSFEFELGSLLGNA